MQEGSPGGDGAQSLSEGLLPRRGAGVITQVAREGLGNRMSYSAGFPAGEQTGRRGKLVNMAFRITGKAGQQLISQTEEGLAFDRSPSQLCPDCYISLG